MTETVDTGTGEVMPSAPPATQMSLWQEGSFASLVEGADFVEGSRLATKQELLGKPFVITGVHFYPGAGSDFVAVSAVTMDNEPVVFNDGSTGVRRQLVAYLTSKGVIDPGPGEEAAEAGKSRYDRPAA